MSTRKQNERQFKQWTELADGGRRYWYDVLGRHGYFARYVKEVDANEVTLRFYQERYNSIGDLVSVHEKFPKDLGHRDVKG